MISLIRIACEQAALHIPLTIGAFITIGLMKIPDLSIESAFVFGAFFSAQALHATHHAPLTIQYLCAIGTSILGGICVGLTSSMLTRALGIAHLLSAIITIGLFHGINQWVFGTYQSLTMSGFDYYTESMIIGIITILSCLLIYLFCKTQLGYACAVFGMNPLFFKQYGISTSYVYIMGIVLANACAGLSGYLVAQSNNFAEIYMGFGKLLLCITALILGKACIQPQYVLTSSIPFIGITLYFILQQLLISIGVPVQYFSIIQAVIILGILAHTNTKSTGTSDHLGI